MRTKGQRAQDTKNECVRNILDLQYFIFAPNQFIFGQPIASDVLKCMSKKLREIFIFGKVMDVQILAISARGEAGNDLS